MKSEFRIKKQSEDQNPEPELQHTLSKKDALYNLSIFVVVVVVFLFCFCFVLFCSFVSLLCWKTMRKDKITVSIYGVIISSMVLFH